MEEIVYRGDGNQVITFTKEEIHVDSVREKYLQDKQKYLETGVWPEVKYYVRDDAWEYYYYLQLMDKDLNLDKYFDFDYDINKFSRDDLISLINEYGLGVILTIYIYTKAETDLTIDEWINKYKDSLIIPLAINTDGNNIYRK